MTTRGYTAARRRLPTHILGIRPGLRQHLPDLSDGCRSHLTLVQFIRHSLLRHDIRHACAGSLNYIDSRSASRRGQVKHLLLPRRAVVEKHGQFSRFYDNVAEVGIFSVRSRQVEYFEKGCPWVCIRCGYTRKSIPLIK